MAVRRAKQDIYGFKILSRKMQSFKGNATWQVDETKALPRSAKLIKCAVGFHFSEDLQSALYWAQCVAPNRNREYNPIIALVKMPKGTEYDSDCNNSKIWAKSLQIIAILKTSHATAYGEWQNYSPEKNRKRAFALRKKAGVTLEMMKANS